MNKTVLSSVLIFMWLGACATAPSPVRTAETHTGTHTGIHAPVKAPSAALPGSGQSPINSIHATNALPDRSYFHQQDPRWAGQTLGGSGEPLKSDGCLITSAAMALTNLGFHTDPGDLVNRLKSVEAFTDQGWLIWSGLEKVTGGIAEARFYTQADDAHVKNCLADGYYPLVKFRLSSRSTHWAMVVAQGDNDFYIRDPMVSASTPIPLSYRADKIEAVRCVGVSDA